MTDKAQSFWDWFRVHNKAYTFINNVDPEVKETLLNNLLEQLHEYCDKLYFEIGGNADESNELIITAEGNKEFFNEVDNLVNTAPNIDNWTFTAFIPPRDIHFEMNYEGLVLKPEEMWFMPLQNEKDAMAIGISIGLMNYELVHQHAYFNTAMHKILDVLLGEKSAAHDIHYLEFQQLPDVPGEEGMIQLSDLPDYINWKKSNNQHK